MSHISRRNGRTKTRPQKSSWMQEEARGIAEAITKGDSEALHFLAGRYFTYEEQLSGEMERKKKEFSDRDLVVFKAARIRAILDILTARIGSMGCDQASGTTAERSEGPYA